MLLTSKHILVLICTLARAFKALGVYGLERSAAILVHTVADRGLDFSRLQKGLPPPHENLLIVGIAAATIYHDTR